MPSIESTQYQAGQYLELRRITEALIEVLDDICKSASLPKPHRRDVHVPGVFVLSAQGLLEEAKRVVAQK